MAENKVARVPVASHGLHKHSYNYPWLSSMNFGDVMPCYINTLRKGEKDKPNAGVFSQLMPIAHNAFATGRYNFKSIFVPFKMVWRLWYYFSEQTEYCSNGVFQTPHHYPYVTHASLSLGLLISSSISTHLFAEVTSTDPYDIVLHDNDLGTDRYFVAKPRGARILRILGALGCMPSFVVGDDHGDYEEMNILPILCYLKAFADYYFPQNYVGSGAYQNIMFLFDRDDIDFTSYIDEIVKALDECTLNYYENSCFDLAWMNPASPNIGATNSPFVFNDITDTDDILQDKVRTDTNNDGVPYADAKRGFSKYILDALTSVSLWVKRHQLAGARLLDRFLVSRGVSLSNDSAKISYFLGQRNIEIEVNGVENNTDVNLGELAGRGIASSGNKPLSFECDADDDGILLVVVSPLPDANFPILLDGFANRKDFNDNYHSEYDKLGAAAVPTRVVQLSLNGYSNSSFTVPGHDAFGFLSQYWDEIQERPRLLGDFILKSRGAEELSAYHTFRLLSPLSDGFVGYHFVRMDDNEQYQRLFYSEKQENLMLFLRWYGDQYKEKLPLGDSYEWDDDELNRKVSIVIGGSKK